MIKQAEKTPGCPQASQPLVQYYRSFASRLVQMKAAGGGAIKTVGVTSTTRGEGVSTVAANLARLEAVLGGKSVLLVDANEEGGPLCREFFPETRVQQIDWLSPTDDLGAVVAPTRYKGLSAVAVRPASGEEARPDRLVRFLARAGTRFDRVVVDLPAVRSLSSCLEWAPLLDGVVMVVQAERTPVRDALQVKRRLMESRANLLGVVFNRRPSHVPDWL